MDVEVLLAKMQSRIVSESRYFGIPTQKSPLDAWVYQEIIYDVQPDVIVEIGTFHGGSALMLAHLLDGLNQGLVITVDKTHKHVHTRARIHPRIEFFEGDACAVVPAVSRRIARATRVMVIEDSSHTYENTLAVLCAYSPLVTQGSYFIVEDGICHHGLDVGPSPGPYEAIQTFLCQNREFKVDRSREPFTVTWNPDGYLIRGR